MAESLQDLRVTIGADTGPLRRELAVASGLGRDFGRSMTGAFADAALRGRDLSGVVRSLGQELSRAAFGAAIKPLQNALSTGFGNLAAGAFGFADGGVLRRGVPVPFAQGGVVASPIAFPLANGGMGVAGEAGPEAILPLARGADGRLGVRADGAGPPVAITFNVTTPDAASFQRSESQIAAMLNRAVTRGARNL